MNPPMAIRKCPNSKAWSQRDHSCRSGPVPRCAETPARPRDVFGRLSGRKCASYVPMSDITKLLGNVARGDDQSLNQLYELVFNELRAMAAHKMATERPGHTLQPTALVSEAYLRLGGPDGFKFENRAHFFTAAAEAMRRILVDSARRKRQLKRGGEQEQVELSETQIAAPVEDDKLLLINEALDVLAREDPVKAEVVKLRYFVGLKHQDIAEALGVSEPTVRRHWAVAKVRLYELIAGNTAEPDGPDAAPGLPHPQPQKP